MADTRTTSLLETFLSIKDSKAELLSQLELREAARLSLTCKSIYTLFKQPLAVAKLLDLVIKAEWNKIKNLVAANPLLMFQLTDGIDINGTKIKCSPLHYLLYVHDYYGQEIFEACARKHNLLKEFVATHMLNKPNLIFSLSVKYMNPIWSLMLSVLLNFGEKRLVMRNYINYRDICLLSYTHGLKKALSYKLDLAKAKSTPTRETG